MLNNNWLALLVTFTLALIWLRINDFIAQRGWISSDLSRKIIHVGTGPIFVLCWLLFKDDAWARYLAALVPLAITLQFLLVGTGVIRDEAAVQAMSRTGERREILRGPLIYGIVFVVLTIWLWQTTPIGITALMLMCGGDGLADILGRRYGKARLSWNKQKSWAGSLGMLLGGWLLTVIVIGIYTSLGFFSRPLGGYLPAITFIAVAGTIVESLPVQDLDNLTVSLAAVILGFVLF